MPTISRQKRQKVIQASPQLEYARVNEWQVMVFQKTGQQRSQCVGDAPPLLLAERCDGDGRVSYPIPPELFDRL
jgi:hypothetical protein